jgi:hypothetical protein
MIDAGFGKGELKRIPKAHINSVEINGSRTHIEQLIGKMIKKPKSQELEPVMGYFDKKVVIADECQTLIKEETPALASLMAEFRKALDIWNKNKVEKKLVGDKETLAYYPESRVMLLMHKTGLPPQFFDFGSSRRFFLFEISLKKLTRADAERDYYINVKTEDGLEEYINFPSTGVEEIRFDDVGRDLIKDWVYNFQRFGLNHDNPKIKTLMFISFFSLNTYFFKCVNVLAAYRRERIPSADTINTACFDCVQFLLETFKSYVENSSVDLSRVVWEADEADDAWLLQWMYYNNGTCEERTPMGVSEVQERIGNLRGIHDRMAKRVYSKLKAKGVIKDKHLGHTTKCWTDVRPKIDGSIELIDYPPIDYKQYLLEKKKELGYEVNQDANVGN